MKLLVNDTMLFRTMQIRPIKFAQPSSPNASSPNVQVRPTSARAGCMRYDNSRNNERA